MIPLSQIITNVRTRHESLSTVRWSDADIRDAVNEGLDDLAESTLFYERHVSVPIGNLRTYYDLRGWLPESALGVTAVWNTVTALWLEPITVADFGFQWERSVGPSLSFFMRGVFWMGVWPKAAASTGVLRTYFAGLPPHFDYPQAVLSDLPDQYIPALEEYALYELAAQDGETNRALMHFNDYTAREKILAQFVNRRTVTARTLRMSSR